MAVLPWYMNERFFVLLDVDPGVMGLGSDPVWQLLLEPDQQSRDPLHWLRGRHQSNRSKWQFEVLCFKVKKTTSTFAKKKLALFWKDFLSVKNFCYIDEDFLVELFLQIIRFCASPSRWVRRTFQRPLSTVTEAASLL